MQTSQYFREIRPRLDSYDVRGLSPNFEKVYKGEFYH